MKVGILVLAAGRSAGGPEIYEISLVRALAQLDGRNRYFIYCTDQAAADAFGTLSANFRLRVLQPAYRAISLALTLPRWMKADAIDVLHATYAPPPVQRLPLLFTMHCFSNFAHPEYYPAFVRWRLNALQRLALRRAATILCVSDFVAGRLHEEFRIPAARLRTVYNGVDPGFRPMPPQEARQRVAAQFQIGEPYILYVGKLQARKNIIGLIRAYARYRSQTASPAKLVLAGKRVETSEGIDEAIAALGLTGELKQVGYLAPPAIDPASLLPHLYSAAHMTVLPSFYEGFGIPVVEAMACGCPVIASNVTALPEIGGGAARLVNPESIEDMASALVELDCDAQLRARFAGLGLERARAFTWENCARQTLAAYEALAGGATATLSASSSPARD